MIALLQNAIAVGIVYLYGCIGEITNEKVGHLNLGIPGIMSMGALGGVIGVNVYFIIFGTTNIITPLILIITIIFSMLFAALGGLIYAFFTITLKSNQNVTGLILTTFGLGVMKGIGKMVYSSDPTNISNFTNASNAIKTLFVGYQNLGWFGEIFLSYGLLVYLAIILAVVIHIIFKKTKFGLYARAIGESPQTADAQGINVNRYKYIFVILGSAIAGLGGLYYVMDRTRGSSFLDVDIQAFGWVSVALVIFSMWKPLFGIAGSILFGLLSVLGSFIPGSHEALFEIIPYLVTIVVLIINSIVDKRGSQAPRSLGLNYDREER